MAADFDYSFRELAAPFVSASQSARVWTETWVLREMFCPACGETALRDLPNNAPVADFDCEACGEQYELKSSKTKFGKKIVDGAYRTMIERLQSDTVPSLMLLRYNATLSAVQDITTIPGRFFVPDIIEERPPLASTARRAGWIGCNILIDRVPDIGRIEIIAGQIARSRKAIKEDWDKSTFLDEKSVRFRGWLLDVLWCVERLKISEFTLAQIYGFEQTLARKYPGNRNIKPKIRQQLQVLRDNGVIEFLGDGRYCLK